MQPQVRYGYDSLGRRLWKTVYSNLWGAWVFAYTRRYLWDGGNLVAELDGNNAMVTGYTWGPTGLLAVTDYAASGGPKTYVVAEDLSGNVQALVDPAIGVPVASFHYDPYGKRLSGTGPERKIDSPLGKEEYSDYEVKTLGFSPHPSGNGDLRVVNYVTNGFMQHDVAGELAGGLNLYQLDGGDPVNKSDPSGEDFIKAGENHFNPLYLGGANEQPVGYLGQPEHIAFHDYLDSQGLGFGNGNGSTARANWQQMGQVERINTIVNAARASKLTSQQMSVLEENMPRILAGENPGIRTSRVPANMGPSMWAQPAAPGTMASAVSIDASTEFSVNELSIKSMSESLGAVENLNVGETTALSPAGGMNGTAMGAANNVMGFMSLFHVVLDGLDVRKQGGPPQQVLVKQAPMAFHDANGDYTVEMGGVLAKAWKFFNDDTADDASAPYPRKVYNSGPLYDLVNQLRQKRGEAQGPAYMHLYSDTDEYKEIMKLHDQAWEDAIEDAKWRESHPTGMWG
jgi:hypothetical protein